MRQSGWFLVAAAVLGGLGGCAKQGGSQEQLDALSAELSSRAASLEALEARVRAIEGSPGQLNHRYLEELRKKQAALTPKGGGGPDQMAEGTIGLIDCSALGCPTTPGSTAPPAGIDVGKVSTDADTSSPAIWTEDWYITEPFYRYDPRRPAWKGTYIHNYSSTQLTGPPGNTVKQSQQVFTYAEVPDPSGYNPTPSGVPRYLYDVRNVSNGNASAVRGELYREIISDNGVVYWVDHWVLYDSYKEPSSGVNAKIVNRSVPAGDGLPDFLGKYYQNPGGICGSECTYATMIYAWQ